MFRKTLLAAVVGLGFGTAAHAGLAVPGGPAGFSFTGSWTAFDLAVNVTATAGSAVGDYEVPPALTAADLPAGVDGLQMPTLGVSLLSGGGTLTQGQNPAGNPDLNNGRFSVDDNAGSRGSGVFIEGGSTALTIDFASAIQAFGFWGTDIGDFGTSCTAECTGDGSSEAFTVDLYNGGTHLGTFHLSGKGTDGSSDYYGFVGSSSNLFTRVVITNSTAGQRTSPADGQGFSRFSVGTADTTPVPEPGILGLVGLGLLAAGRRKRAS